MRALLLLTELSFEPSMLTICWRAAFVIETGLVICCSHQRESGVEPFFCVSISGSGRASCLCMLTAGTGVDGVASSTGVWSFYIVRDRLLLDVCLACTIVLE